MRYVSLFSGIEAATVAWEPLGWEPAAFAEVDPFCCALLDYRFPHVPNLGDVRKIDWSGYVGAVDLVVGGSPCQSFSVAGKREGLKGESGLMLEYIRAVSELRPTYFVWENVPGALSSEKGAAFGQLLSEMDGLGYGLAWRILDAQYFGVAQRRRRVFLVGVLGERDAPAEVLFEPESLGWDTPPGKEKRQELADAARGCDRGPDGLDARDGSGCVAFRHSVSGSRGFAESEDLSPTLAAARCGEPAVMAFNAGNSNDVSCIGEGNVDLSPALRSARSGTNGVPTVCMASGQANAEVGHDVCPTMSSRQRKDPPIVVASNGEDFVGSLCAADSKMVGNQLVSSGKVIAQRVRDFAEGAWVWPWIVRRLTPLECERLQGFPDFWTLIPYRGRPAEKCPDSPRYSALGNSFAVPVVRWIGERIAVVEAELGLTS